MVMCRTIGNKNIFAIEYQLSDCKSDLIGYVRLWISGKYLGYFDDRANLGVVADVLNDVRRNFDNLEFPQLQDKSIEEVYEAVKGNADDNAYYHLILGDTFDDFSMLVFVRNMQFEFIWKLNEDTFFEYGDYPDNLLCGRVPKDIFNKVVEDFCIAIGLTKKT